MGDNLCDMYYSSVSNGFKHGLMRDLNVGFKCIKINIFAFLLNINTTLVYSWIKFVMKILTALNYNSNKIPYTLTTFGFLNTFLWIKINTVLRICPFIFIFFIVIFDINIRNNV